MTPAKVALIGFGELGRYTRTVLDEYLSVAWESSVFFDDAYHRSGAPNAFPFAEHTDARFADHRFYVCLGYKHLAAKASIVSRLVELGREVPSFVHPSSWVHPSVALGHGTFLYPGVNIDRSCVIGDATWLSNGTIIAHDSVVGPGCWFGASVTICGKVTVGARTFLGSGAVVSNDVTVGSDVVVGLATAVTKSVADGASVIGNPMRVLDKKIALL
jgi:sugar O-acyltransferase (sialic acid O-acetyltransferase NeuD family)